MEKQENIILIPPCGTYGDILSIISLCYFLETFYKNVFIFFDDGSEKMMKFWQHYFNNDSRFNKSISLFFEKELTVFLEAGVKGEFHFCDVHTGDWYHKFANYRMFFHPKVDKDFYFCDTNPLYNFLQIENKYLCIPNKSLPLIEKEINSIVYYKMIGLNNEVRMNFFHYERDRATEEKMRDKFYLEHDIKAGMKFNICNSLSSHGDFVSVDMMKSKITNEYPCIDINNACEFPGWLCLLLEEAEEIHLIESLNTNFIYYLQYKNLLNIHTKKVFFHIWARNRDWKQYNLDYSWKMMDNPHLPNWIYLF